MNKTSIETFEKILKSSDTKVINTTAHKNINNIIEQISISKNDVIKNRLMRFKDVLSHFSISSSQYNKIISDISKEDFTLDANNIYSFIEKTMKGMNDKNSAKLKNLIAFVITLE